MRTPRELAEIIAADLFTEGATKNMAKRLAVVFDEDMTARGCTGWSFGALVGRIEKHLMKNSNRLVD